MKKIKMLRDQKGSRDGITIELFEKDHEYDVNESLAKAFVKYLHCAIEVEIEKPIEQLRKEVEKEIVEINTEIKNAEIAENKAMNTPKNKSGKKGA